MLVWYIWFSCLSNTPFINQLSLLQKKLQDLLNNSTVQEGFVEFLEVVCCISRNELIGLLHLNLLHAFCQIF